MHMLLLLANSHAFPLRTHYFNRLLGWLWVPNRLPSSWLWGGFEVALPGFLQSAFCLLPSLVVVWTELPGTLVAYLIPERLGWREPRAARHKKNKHTGLDAHRPGQNS
jgi:hypothetical protein